MIALYIHMTRTDATPLFLYVEKGCTHPINWSNIVSTTCCFSNATCAFLRLTMNASFVVLFCVLL